MAGKFITVAVVGETNVGKSTLTNALVGRKVSITTPKAQTTRSAITGIILKDGVQIAFTDYPGIFTPKNKLDKAMVKCAWSGLHSCHLVLLVVDASKGSLSSATSSALNRLKKSAQKVTIVLNKIDLSSFDIIKSLTDALASFLPQSEQFRISAISKTGINALIEHIRNSATDSDDELLVSATPLEYMAAEITREQIFLQVGGEVPYGLKVETESLEHISEDVLDVTQVITVLKESHKMILIGKGGFKLRSIGHQARKEMYRLFKLKVHLRLFIRVRKEWIEKLRENSF